MAGEDIEFFFPTIEGYYVLTLESDLKGAYLLPYSCKVNKITQNHTAGTKEVCQIKETTWCPSQPVFL